MQSRISGFDFARSVAGLETELAEIFLRVVHSGQVILGPETRRFEAEFAQFVDAREAVGVASGTDALILALRALDVGPDHEVITVANTAVPTASAIRAVGAIPVFADVNLRTMNICAKSVADRISKRTRAVIPVHLYGLPADMSPLMELAASYRLALIEDCAHAHGARVQEQHVGTLGNIGCYSFYPTKNLGAMGDAGACVTNDPALAERLRALRMYGFSGRRIAEFDGINSRLDELQAAILCVQLQRLAKNNQRRREIAERYRRELAGEPILLQELQPDSVHAWHQFVIRVSDRPQFLRDMTTRGVQCGIHYEHALHQMPAFRRESQPLLPNTERLVEEIVSLPMTPYLTDEEVSTVIAAVRESLRETAGSVAGDG